MRIHYYHQFFAGPNAPGSQQPRKLVGLLAERGHEVSVIATDFNVDNEQDEPEEHSKNDSGGSVRVYRLLSARSLRSNLKARLKTYLGFAIRARRFGRRLPAPGVVIGGIQPIFTGWAALRVARRRRVPFILEMRDLWPDALEVKGAVTGWKAWLLHRLASRLYAAADRIVSVTPGIKAELVKKGVPAGRIDVFPNGFDPELFAVPPAARERVRADYGWGNSFVAVYTGTHTEVTAIDVIVRAAAVLKDRSNVRFDLFGRGQTKPAVMQLAEQLQVKNIHFHDPVPKSVIPAVLAAADVALMTLFKSPLAHIYFENKFMDYLGAGKPILAAMNGHQSQLIERYRAGRVVPPLDHAGLARLVAEAADNYAPFLEMGENGRRLVEKHLLLPTILTHYADMIEAVASGRGAEMAPWEPLLQPQ